MRLLLALGLVTALAAQRDPLQHARTLSLPAAMEFLGNYVRGPEFPGCEPVVRAAIHSSIGSLAHELGRYRDAERAFRQSAQVCEAEGVGVGCALSPWNGLLALYLEHGQLAQASQILKRSARIGIDEVGATNVELIRWWGNHGAYEFARERPAAAIEWYRRSLDGWTRIGKRDSLDGVIVRSNLGLAYLQQKRYREAVEVLEEVRAQFAQPNPLPLTRLPVALSNLGLAKAALGETTEAAALLQAAAVEAEHSHGADHPVTARILLNYGEFLTQQRQKAEARRVRKRAESIIQSYVQRQGLQHTVDLSTLGAR